MSQDNFTPLVDGDNGDAATFNAVFGELDAVIGDVATVTAGLAGTPASLAEAALELLGNIGDVTGLADVGDGTETDAVGAVVQLQEILGVVSIEERLAEWAAAGAYQMTSITYHASYVGVIAGATVVWPDGSAGTLTATSTNAVWKTVDAYTITHTDSGLTVTQASISRNAYGYPTTPPALSVA